jgi:hypothetical protein
MATKTADDYVGLITPWQSTKARFVATVRAGVQPYADAQAVIASLPGAFDLDDAIGAQLDATGQWIGPTRYVPLPIITGYFSLDVDGLGLDQGVLREAYSDATTIYALDDDVYRRLLYAVIAANHWDGTVPGAQAVFDTFFTDPATHVFVQDNAQAPYPYTYFSLDIQGQGLDEGLIYSTGTEAATSQAAADVSMTIGVSGKIPPPIYLGLLAQNALRIKPAGVETTYTVTTVDGAALFGLDVGNEFVAGLDIGAIGASPSDLLAA